MTSRNIEFKWFIVLCFVVVTRSDNFMEEQGIRLRLERVTCICDPKTCVSVTCGVKFVSRTVVTYNTELIVKRNVNRMLFHLKTFLKASNNEYRPMLINVQEELCDSKRAEVKPGIVSNVVLNNLKDGVTNFQAKCPVTPGKYFAKDFNFGAKHLPSIFPEGRYLMEVNLSGPTSDKWIVSWKIYFNVKNYGVLDLNVG
ncbi:hypothetical protein Bhyg_15011 [Pseudolycoriella hygida]|uniref:MD-2-related lipid-recognition domain-containing protein n=1 Tax=Pseudolycoriella hygida TaxID=35572 RepID=A0A9Q0MR63_9DIPT|nr:hypothetical protein Bhyg_15011 [Pseudolycoriella hygida]